MHTYACTYTRATVHARICTRPYTHTHILYIYSILPNWNLQGTDENGSSNREFKLSGVQVIGGSSYRDYTVSTHACTVTHTHTHTHVRRYTHACMRTTTHTEIHMYADTCYPPHTHTHTHTEINTAIHTYIHTYIHTINMRCSKFLTVHDLFLTMMKIVYGLGNLFTVKKITVLIKILNRS